MISGPSVPGWARWESTRRPPRKVPRGTRRSDSATRPELQSSSFSGADRGCRRALELNPPSIGSAMPLRRGVGGGRLVDRIPPGAERDQVDGVGTVSEPLIADRHEELVAIVERTR